MKLLTTQISVIGLLLCCGCGSDEASESRWGKDGPKRYQAVVLRFEPGSPEKRLDPDDNYAGWDQLFIEVTRPSERAGQTIRLLLKIDQLESDSPYRVSGTRFAFTLPRRWEDTKTLSWGALIHTSLIEPDP